MDEYLAKLHSKPDHHKKRFAFLVSSTITLFIFGVWSLATFGINREVVITKTESEVGPLESLRSSLASSFEALRSSFKDLKTGIGSVDIETEYTEMRDNALEVYGQ